MKTVDIKDATASLRHYAEGMGGEAVILTDHGKPVAALLAIDNADYETVALSTNPEFLRIIRRARARQADERGIPSDQMRHRLGLTRPAPDD